MNRIRKTAAALCCGAALLACGAQAQAAEVQVHWQDPEHFSDIRPTTETREAFQATVIEEFNQIFADLAKKMPEGVRWNITVTDLDLAGEVRPVFGFMSHEIRIVKSLYWPRMSLEYQLLDQDGHVLASGKETIQDMSFMMHAMIPSGHTRFEYEEQMLKDWFRHQQRAQVFPALTPPPTTAR